MSPKLIPQPTNGGPAQRWGSFAKLSCYSVFTSFNLGNMMNSGEYFCCFWKGYGNESSQDILVGQT